ncbi:hypothetical protein [Parashewanella spongiae]|uniref:hypothetical protein n=1 Tax=Parashewanella spongiae TaxID=342950 RepID=UPI001FD4E115|nr:hypothetical protein [Parashewanella spongiae]
MWRAKGTAGIDEQSLEQFASNLSNELDKLLIELKTKQYRPSAVKRVEIPKDDGGVRKLGIPTVRDRIVQQCLNDILSPIFEEQFHPSTKKNQLPLHPRNLVSRPSVDQIEFLAFSALCG